MANGKLIVGNWKMHPSTLDEAKELAKRTKRSSVGLTGRTIVVCPPSIYLAPIIKLLEDSNVEVGGQNVSINEEKSQTGDVDSKMLKALGIKYIIIGHSEQRMRGETDEKVAKKLNESLKAGLSPILCVGEGERDENGKYLDLLKKQIMDSLTGIEEKFASKIIIAYEPVWAIGAKEPLHSEQIYEMSLFVKKVFSDVFGHNPAMKIRVLYGGAVNAGNAKDIIIQGNVDGLLIGRESLNPTMFGELIRSIDK